MSRYFVLILAVSYCVAKALQAVSSSAVAVVCTSECCLASTLLAILLLFTLLVPPRPHLITDDSLE